MKAWIRLQVEIELDREEDMQTAITDFERLTSVESDDPHQQARSVYLVSASKVLDAHLVVPPGNVGVSPPPQPAPRALTRELMRMQNWDDYYRGRTPRHSWSETGEVNPPR